MTTKIVLTRNMCVVTLARFSLLQHRVLCIALHSDELDQPG